MTTISSVVTTVQNATSADTDNTLVERDASGNFAANIISADLAGNAATATNFTGALVGDVTGTQTASVVSKVGGSTAANVHNAELAANGATSVNTASALVARDGNGDFAARNITSSLIGNASTATLATNVTTNANLTGDVTSVGNATTVVSVAGSSASNVHSAELLANAATNVNTASAIVKRDVKGDFSARIITAALNGNASTATSATNVTTNANLTGDVTSVGNATTAVSVGGSSANNIHNAELLANAAMQPTYPDTDDADRRRRVGGWEVLLECRQRVERGQDQRRLLKVASHIRVWE